jgi:hypothetical protein
MRKLSPCPIGYIFGIRWLIEMLKPYSEEHEKQMRAVNGYPNLRLFELRRQFAKYSNYAKRRLMVRLSRVVIPGHPSGNTARQPACPDVL